VANRKTSIEVACGGALATRFYLPHELNHEQSACAKRQTFIVHLSARIVKIDIRVGVYFIPDKDLVLLAILMPGDK
jgi:hypothetical protein